MIIGLGAKPDRLRVFAKQRVRLFVRHDQSARCEHRALGLREKLSQRFAFEPAEVRFTVHLEDHGKAHARVLRDERVELDERDAEVSRGHRAERALARTAQPEKRNHAA